MSFLLNPYRYEDDGGTPLLDTYTANAAYSLRKLKTGVTNVVECRRNDGTIRDFTATEITDGTLETWASGTLVTIRTMYDQSGNGNHAVQTTVSRQNKIYSGSSLYLLGSRPAFETIPLNGWLNITALDLDDMFFVGKIDSYVSVNYIAYGSNGGVFTGGTTGGINGTGVFTSPTIRSLSDESLIHSLHYFHRDSGNTFYEFAKNGGVPASVGIQNKLTNVNIAFGRNASASLNYNGTAQEMIFFPDVSSDYSAIANEINAYYSIY